MTSRLTLLAACALAAAVFAITHYAPIPYGLKELAAMGGGEKILDLAPAFTGEAVHARLEAFGAEGRAVYQRFAVTTDVAFPLALLVFLLVFARFAGERASLPRTARGLVLAVPVVWFAADMIENLTIFTLIAQFPARNDLLEPNLGYVTLAKRALLLASLALPVLLLLWTMARRLGAGRNAPAN
ncbi:MAG: hypothetical protein Q8J92_12900 [Parvibaculum sp.]|nr:hypothetical protein [Parvibaculum sp.]